MNSSLTPINPSLLQQLKGKVFYGIDLGTTYTVVARIVADESILPGSDIQVKLTTIEQHSPFEFDGADKSDMMASVLAVNADNQMFVGNKVYRLKGHPFFRKDKNLFYHWKLDLGISRKPLYAEAVRSDVDDAAKVAGKILNYARRQLASGDQSWNNVTVTVPASFQANQRKDVKQAMEYASIAPSAQQLIDEPNAALIGYLHQLTTDERRVMLHNGAKMVLVLDFGGGTCDLSLVELKLNNNNDLTLTNKAISRYNDLGGQDLDTIIAENYLWPEFQRQFPSVEVANEVLELQLLPQLAVAAEKLKIDLSRSIASRYANPTEINVDEMNTMSAGLTEVLLTLDNDTFLLRNPQLTGKDLAAITRFIFQAEEYRLEITDKTISSIPTVIDDCLKKANTTRNRIHYVLLAGGSIQNPIFVHELAQLLPSARCLVPARPDTLVAKGAALHSFYKNGLNIDLIRAINSERIGIITANQPFFALVEAGTPLPASFELPVFSLQNDRQRLLTIPFCIGDEKAMVQELQLQVPASASNDTRISIRGELSVDKLFRVEVWIDNRKTGEIELRNPFVLATVSEEQRDLMLALMELEQARSAGKTNAEEVALLSVISEYYGVANHARCIHFCNEYSDRFSPTSSTVLNYLYCACDALGQHRKAKEAIEKGVKYHPSNATLQYNYSLVIESEQGTKAALNYLNSLPGALQKGATIRIRIALLEKETGNDTVPLQLIDDHRLGKFKPATSFAEHLLRRLYSKMNIPYPDEETTPSPTAKKKFNTAGLLVVKTDLPVQL